MYVIPLSNLAMEGLDIKLRFNGGGLANDADQLGLRFNPSFHKCYLMPGRSEMLRQKSTLSFTNSDLQVLLKSHRLDPYLMREPKRPIVCNIDETEPRSSSKASRVLQ